MIYDFKQDCIGRLLFTPGIKGGLQTSGSEKFESN